MKLKYYLRGAGIGIIVAVLIMVIGGGGATMTDAQVIKRAEELGMVKSTATSEKISDHINKKKDQSEAASSEATPDESTPAEPSASEPESGQSQSAAQDPGTPVPEGTAGIADEGNSVKITVEVGMLSDKISQRLAEAGLVPNADEYNKFLISKGYDSKMYAGVCTIPKGADFEQIAQILMSKTK